MRRITLLLLCGVAALSGASAAAQPAFVSMQGQSPAGSADRALVFDHVTVVDVVRGELVPAQRVVVAGNRIQALGPVDAVPLPRGARVIDARGKYLIPGLWDMYLHLWSTPDSVGYPLLIANGVTGLRDPGSPVPLATLTRWKREIAAGTRVGPRLVVAGPTIFRCPIPPPATDANSGVCLAPSRPSADSSADGDAALGFAGFTYKLKDVHALVDSLKTAGADYLEIDVDSKFSAEPVGLYYALTAAARQAGLPFGGRAPVWVGDAAVDSGARFVNNQAFLSLTDLNACDGWYAKAAGGVADCTTAADHLRQHDTWVVVTPPLPRLRYQVAQYRRYLPRGFPRAPVPSGDAPARAHVGFDIAAWFARAGSIPATTRPTSTAAWRAALDDVDSITGTPLFPAPHQGRVQEAAGLPIVIGTDAVFAPSAFVGLPGFSLHDALAMLVVDGMTPAAALRAATLNPAKALHLADSLGTVEVGKLADLVLLDANPLAEINNTATIRAVVANGRYFDRSALDMLLARAEQAARRWKP